MTRAAIQETNMDQSHFGSNREQVVCQQGLVLSAYRQGFGQMENAA